MTPVEEIQKEENRETDCESVKLEWAEASKTGRVSADLMQKALKCKLVPEEKVKGMPNMETSLPPREDNPLAGEDKELGMAELIMAYDPWTGETDFTPDTYDPSADIEKAAQEQLSTPEPEYVQDSNGNWYFTENTPSGGISQATANPNYGQWNGQIVSKVPDATHTIMIKLPSGKDEKTGQVNYSIFYMDKEGFDASSEVFSKMYSGEAGGEGGRILNQINPNYFGGETQKPSDMGNMEWHYKYGDGMYSNTFNPERFYFNPDDKGNAGQTSSPYARISNRGNMTPEVVKSNRPFYDVSGIDKYTNQDELKYKNRLMQMAEVVSPGQDTPMGAAVDQSQGASQEVDEQVQEQLKEAISQAGFNVVDIAMSPEGKILVTVGQFEDSYIENAQYFEMDFELAEPMKCRRRFKAIAVTPGMYKAKDGTLVELSSQQLNDIAGLFRNKPLVLVDHDLARPDSTHEGKNVGFVEDSWYDPDYDAVIYKGVLGEDLDLAAIAGSSIKLTHGKTPMGRHIALIPKCVMGKACYAPQDPNAVILENAQKIGER